MPTATTSTLATRAKYGVKAVFTILSHVPPTLDQVIERRKPALLDGISYQDRLKFACDNPPLNSAGVQSATPQRHSLTITGAMPRFSGSGPHVVTCQLDNDKTTYVAKIFDGMDYPLPTQAILEQDDPWDDFMSQADYDYSAEARAYEFLQEPAANIRLEDLPIPEYHGSWTLTLPIEKYRLVRLVLLEYIEGESLATIIDRKALPSETERLKLLAKIVEADEYLEWAGVDHRDMAPRNVMVTSSGIKIIDFNRAAVWAKHKGKLDAMRRLYGWPNKPPPSPIERKWIYPGWGNGSWFIRFEKWVPASWIIEEQDDEDIEVFISDEKANEWLAATFKNSPNYQPLTQRFMTERRHARESRKLKGLIGYKG